MLFSEIDTPHGLLALSFALGGSLVFRFGFSFCLSRGYYISSLSLSLGLSLGLNWGLLEWLPALHHSLKALWLRNDIDGSRRNSIGLGGVDASTNKQGEMNHCNNIRDDGGSIRNALLMAKYGLGSNNIWVVGVVSARIHVVVQGGTIFVRALVVDIVAVVAVPRVLEPGAKERGQDDGHEEDDEGEGDVGTGVDAAFEFARGAGDELGAAPEGSDDALFFFTC